MNTTTLASSSNTGTLTLQENGQVMFRLQGIHTWQNAGPLFVLHYYDRQHPRAQFVPVPSDNSHTFGTAGTPSLSATGRLIVRSAEAGSWTVEAEFREIAIRITLCVTTRDNGFSVRINEGDLIEGKPHLYRVLSLELLPDFGAARTGDEGYLTLPNWSGCQTFFNKDYPREVRQTVYSSNDQWEHNCNMPVFGITRQQGTLCGIIAAGDLDARLISRVHWEKDQINGVHPDLVYRWEQQDDRIAGPREVRYQFAAPDDVSGEGYVFCGKALRAFLRAERGLKNWAQKAKDRPVVLDYADRFFVKIFMACKTPQADGKGPYHAVCTFDQTREILQKCLDRGMSKLAVMLVGWGQDGHDGMPPTRFPVDERLGGEAGFKRLIAWCKEHDILLGVHDSYGGEYSCSPEFDTHDLIRHRSGEYWESIIWSGGQVHNACPAVFVEKHVKRDIPAIRKLGLYGHHHIDAVGSFMPCYCEEHPLKLRADFVRKVHEMFEIAIEQMGSVSTEYPYGPYFDVIDGIFHSYSKLGRWHRASPPGRYFLDQMVPLLQVVLHGSVNCGLGIAKEETPLLSVLDMGMTPQIEFGAVESKVFGIPSFEQMVQKFETTYRACYGGQGIIPRLGRLTIESRVDLAKQVSRTTYSDGTVVMVNSSDVPFEGLAARSFKVLNGTSASLVQQ